MEKDENYYQNLDKRTKEYKEWKAKREEASEGLGDTLEKVFEATGVANVVKFVAGEDCGCDERKARLNKLFRYRKPNCFTEDEYVYLSELFSSNIGVIDPATQRKLIKISNRVFNRNQQVSSCGVCVRKLYSNLKKYYDLYNEEGQ